MTGLPACGLELIPTACSAAATISSNAFIWAATDGPGERPELCGPRLSFALLDSFRASCLVPDAIDFLECGLRWSPTSAGPSRLPMGPSVRRESIGDDIGGSGTAGGLDPEMSCGPRTVGTAAMDVKGPRSVL